MKTGTAAKKKQAKTKKEVAQKTATTKPAKESSKSWSTRLDQCKEFMKAHDHCKIPTNYKENKSLGIWVQETRRNYKLIKQGKQPRKPLTEEQMDQLDEIGFHWGFTPDPKLSSETEASWETNFAKLEAYKEEHGDFDVPLEGETKKLAIWARVQRHQEKQRKSKVKSSMNKDRFKKLKGIGFDWDGPRDIPK